MLTVAMIIIIIINYILTPCPFVLLQFLGKTVIIITISRQLWFVYFIQEKVSDVRMAALAASIEQIRRIRTTLDKLGNFLEMLNTTLGGYRPLQTCVDRLVDRADCDSCIVPRVLCSNWCGALARACYSPFYDTFNGQFRRFWAIVRQVVEQIPRQLQRVNQNRKVIDINPRQFVSNHFRLCSVLSFIASYNNEIAL